jgi:hypothetical protein
MDVFIKRITAMLFLMLVFVAVPGVAAPNEPVVVTNPKTGKEFVFTSIAIENLKLLGEILVELGMSNHLEALQGIMLVETRAGTGGSVGLPTAHWTRRSYGLMQLTVPTARCVLRDNPHLVQQYFGQRSWQSITISEMRVFLIKNKHANITMGALLFKQYLEMTRNEWARAVAGYNMGIGNALKRPAAPKAKYVYDVREMQRVAKLLNERLAALQPVPSTTMMPVVDIPNALQDSESTSLIKENNNGEGEEPIKQTD